MIHFSRPKVLGFVAMMAALYFLVVNFFHFRALVNESTQTGFMCRMSHQWFGKIDLDEAGWRKIVPGWRISSITTQRGYYPHSTPRLAAAINHFPGPEFFGFYDLPEGVLEELLADLRSQPSVVQMVINRYEGNDATWGLLKCFPNVEDLEIVSTNATGATLPAFPKLVWF